VQHPTTEVSGISKRGRITERARILAWLADPFLPDVP